MRLFEVIDFSPRNSMSNKTDYLDRLQNMTSSELKGRGHFGVVTQNPGPKRINQVRKVGTAGRVGRVRPEPVARPEEDGYLSYLKMVYEFTKEGGDNPYFPRVQELKIRRDRRELSYSVDLDKLVPYNNRLIYNQELITSIKEHMFDVEDDWLLKEIGLSALVTMACDGSNRKIIKDPDLLKAIQMIDEVARKGRFIWDMGSQNMMWRITGNKPQLVLTDPLA